MILKKKINDIQIIQVMENIIIKQIEFSDANNIFNTIDSQREYLGKWLSFIEFTFNDLDIHRIQIKCASGNFQSKKYTQKLEFKLEGI